MQRYWLNVRYEERDKAKALGARWDPLVKMWFWEGGACSQPQPALLGFMRPEDRTLWSRVLDGREAKGKLPSAGLKGRSKKSVTQPNHIDHPLWSRTDLPPWDESLGEFRYQ